MTLAIDKIMPTFANYASVCAIIGTHAATTNTASPANTHL
eukprot:CAMPEP_0169164006 /NCGR_PEP_ID=MMETSP1015-20121227/58589_1 /TAXON_ID=342587 /ORGANISM="Karlodinium micrum, Strain CCMP2283" /LENGTH=39 /DNA_ID= /DNA_START= /DNA_END= /DNA_ORIENTATION=